jgi:hypothetical protein
LLDSYLRPPALVAFGTPYALSESTKEMIMETINDTIQLAIAATSAMLCAIFIADLLHRATLHIAERTERRRDVRRERFLRSIWRAC